MSRVKRQLIRAIYVTVSLLMALILVKALPEKDPGSSLTNDSYLAVVEVFDGDTISVQRNGVLEKIRLIGVDTPETKDPRKPVQCFGEEASRYTHTLLDGRQVRIEIDPTQGERDRYDRILAYVWRDDGLMINKSLVEEGYAHEYTYQDNAYKYQNEFRTGEASAQDRQKGLWSPDTCNGQTK